MKNTKIWSAFFHKKHIFASSTGDNGTGDFPVDRQFFFGKNGLMGGVNEADGAGSWMALVDAWGNTASTMTTSGEIGRARQRTASDLPLLKINKTQLLKYWN